jgi:hypothetical protein
MPGTDDINSGNVNLTLAAENAIGSFVDDEMNLMLIDTPESPVVPEGPDYVNLYNITTSEYTTEPVTFSDYYECAVDPLDAGNIDGMGTTGTITWNTSFLGIATISVRAMNTCGNGEYSDGFNVTVDNFVSVEELDTYHSLNIFPNPNNGEFTIELKGEALGEIDIKVYDITGTLVYYESGMMADEGFSSRVKMSEYPQGMYFVKVSHDQGSAVRKFLLSK